VNNRNHGEYATNQLPLWPFVCGRVGRITSLASITETIIYKGTAIVCTIVPLVSFIAQIPLDVCVVFRYDKDHWGVLHNFAQFKVSGLLADLVNSD
jgi:hypothetical protein